MFYNIFFYHTNDINQGLCVCVTKYYTNIYDGSLSLIYRQRKENVIIVFKVSNYSMIKVLTFATLNCPNRAGRSDIEVAGIALCSLLQIHCSYMYDIILYYCIIGAKPREESKETRKRERKTDLYERNYRL